MNEICERGVTVVKGLLRQGSEEQGFFKSLGEMEDNDDDGEDDLEEIEDWEELLAAAREQDADHGPDLRLGRLVVGLAGDHPNGQRGQDATRLTEKCI